jgi:hypothetical protein
MQYDVTTASDTSEAGFRRAQLQRKVVMLLLLCGLLVQTVDVFSDVQLYQAIGHAEELERSGATAARLNLTTAGAASPFNVSSPGVLSLNATYANLSAAERAEMCDPVAAAQALSGDAWPAVADTLQGLQRASFIFIIASIVPLLLSFWLAIRQLQTVLQAYRSAETERRTGVQERERRWTRNASIRVVWSQIGVQLLEDGPPGASTLPARPACPPAPRAPASPAPPAHRPALTTPPGARTVPQSVVSAVFIVTMLAKGGSVCNGCFRDSAPTGEFAAGCGVLVIDSFSWEEALRERDEQSAVALGFSLTMWYAPHGI